MTIQGTTELWRNTWQPGWTHFVPFTLGGQAHLLSYKGDNGIAAIDRFEMA
jgi:hypothetical protein